MRAKNIIESFKLLAMVVLGVSLFLPLYSFPTWGGGATRVYAWQVAQENWVHGILLALAYLWPVILMLLFHVIFRSKPALLAFMVEPLLAIFATIMIVVTIHSAFSWQAVPIISWFGFVVPAAAGIGGWMGLCGNALYFLSWLISVAIVLFAERRYSSA